MPRDSIGKKETLVSSDCCCVDLAIWEKLLANWRRHAYWWWMQISSLLLKHLLFRFARTSCTTFDWSVCVPVCKNFFSSFSFSFSFSPPTVPSSSISRSVLYYCCQNEILISCYPKIFNFWDRTGRILEWKFGTGRVPGSRQGLFLTNTQADQELPSHVHGKIWPHCTQFCLDLWGSSSILLGTFFKTPCTLGSYSMCVCRRSMVYTNLPVYLFSFFLFFWQSCFLITTISSWAGRGRAHVKWSSTVLPAARQVL